MYVHSENAAPGKWISNLKNGTRKEGQISFGNQDWGSFPVSFQGTYIQLRHAKGCKLLHFWSTCVTLVEIIKCLPTIAIVFVLYQKQLHDFHWFPAKHIPKNRWLDDVQEIEGGTQFHPHIISLAVPPVHATKRPSALLFRWLSQCCDSSCAWDDKRSIGMPNDYGKNIV